VQGDLIAGGPQDAADRRADRRIVVDDMDDGRGGTHLHLPLINLLTR
jgi:hypothetical protein